MLELVRHEVMNMGCLGGNSRGVINTFCTHCSLLDMRLGRYATGGIGDQIGNHFFVDEYIRVSKFHIVYCVRLQLTLLCHSAGTVADTA
jgi:hypothetical protein